AAEIKDVQAYAHDLRDRRRRIRNEPGISQLVVEDPRLRRDRPVPHVQSADRPDLRAVVWLLPWQHARIQKTPRTSARSGRDEDDGPADRQRHRKGTTT